MSIKTFYLQIGFQFWETQSMFLIELAVYIGKFVQFTSQLVTHCLLRWFPSWFVRMFPLFFSESLVCLKIVNVNQKKKERERNSSFSLPSTGNHVFTLHIVPSYLFFFILFSRCLYWSLALSITAASVGKLIRFSLMLLLLINLFVFLWSILLRLTPFY